MAKKSRVSIFFDKQQKPSGSPFSGKQQQRRNQRYEQDEEPEKNEVTFLQPEILPVQFMSELLLKRGATTNILSTSTREQIVKLFYYHISPKPQRDYNEKRKFMQLLLLGRRKREKISEDVDWKSMVTDSKGTLPKRAGLISFNSSTSSSSSPANDRLKAPPSSNNFSKQSVNIRSPAKKIFSLDDIKIKVRSVKPSIPIAINADRVRTSSQEATLIIKKQPSPSPIRKVLKLQSSTKRKLDTTDDDDDDVQTVQTDTTTKSPIKKTTSTDSSETKKCKLSIGWP